MGNNKTMRRNLSGIYIFDTLEGDESKEPTCIEDCTPEKREKWLNSLEKEALIRTCEHLCKVLKNIGDEFDIITG